MAAPRLSTNRISWSKCRDCGKSIQKGENYWYHPDESAGRKPQCTDCYDGKMPKNITLPIGNVPITPPEIKDLPPYAPPLDDSQREAKTRALVRTIISAVLDDESEQWKSEITAKVLAGVSTSVSKIVSDMMADATKNILVLQRQDGTKVKLDLAHETMPRLIKRINARINTYVYGPAGTGKTHAALQACAACGIPQDSIYLESCNPYYTPHDYKGFENALGNYTESALYRFLNTEGPAAFIVDEFDRQRPDAPSVLNSLLAQGFITFPNGEKKHLTADKVILALGNTNMRGGSTAYSAASRQERSTIDRFTFLYWGIDETLERTIAEKMAEKHPRMAAAWHDWIKSVRRFIAKPENRTLDEVSPTPRSTFDGLTQMIGCDEGFEFAAEDTVCKGMTPDLKSKVLAACPLPRS